MTITRINEFKAADGKAEETYLFLKSILNYIQSSEGCESCELLRHQDCQDKFVVIEKWSSVKAHMKSIEAFPHNEMQAAMLLFAGPPKGDYYYN